jgi:hypothetical protein
MLLDLIRGLVRDAGGRRRGSLGVGAPTGRASEAVSASAGPGRHRRSRFARMTRRFAKWLRRRRMRSRREGPALSPVEREPETGVSRGRFRRLRLQRALHGAGSRFLVIHVPHNPDTFTSNRVTRAIGRGFEWCLKRSRRIKGKTSLNVIFADTLKFPPR